MLVINVRYGETISFDNDRIRLRVERKDRDRVSLNLEAPRDVSIRRLDNVPKAAPGTRQLSPAG